MERIIYDPSTGYIKATVLRHQNLDRILAQFPGSSVLEYNRLPELPFNAVVNLQTLELETLH